MYGKQIYVKKDKVKKNLTETRQSKSYPNPQRTPNLPARRKLAGDPKILHCVDAKITYFFPGQCQLRIYFWKKLIERMKKLFFLNNRKNDSGAKSTNDM